jgi:iron only hydrogenase large subunit-like protein
LKNYFHSVVLNESKCLGCTTCIKSCPTQAIRVRNGKAIIINERCIDCGECIKVCPYHAKDAVPDSIEDIKKYLYKVALVSPTFLSQFGGKVSVNAILTAVKKMGFNDVREVAYSAEILGKVLDKELNKDGAKLPLISSACPAILRLIQVRFPELLPNVVTLESPMEVEARFIRKELKDKGLNNEDIGIFFISPCPAKITSVKKPIGSSDEKSAVNGALAIKDIYMEVRKNIMSLKKIENLQRSSKIGINWARTGGESKFITDACYINVDGIQSVIRVLEEIEREKLRDIAFFEGLACRGGCVGGALVVENNFIAKQRIHQAATQSLSENNITEEEIDEFYNSGILHQTSAITPRLVPPLDDNIAIAIKKAEEIEEIVKRLPGLDCGSCGAPSCLALAEDIVKGNAEEVDCIFLLREELKNLAKNLVDLSIKVPPVILGKNRKKEDKDEGR